MQRTSLQEKEEVVYSVPCFCCTEPIGDKESMRPKGGGNSKRFHSKIAMPRTGLKLHQDTETSAPPSVTEMLFAVARKVGREPVVWCFSIGGKKTIMTL